MSDTEATPEDFEYTWIQGNEFLGDVQRVLIERNIPCDPWPCYPEVDFADPVESCVEYLKCQQAKIDALTECIEEMSKDPAPEHPYHEGLRCGVEDRDIQCRYEAAEYGWEQAFEYIGSIAVNYIPAPPKQQEKIDALEAKLPDLHTAREAMRLFESEYVGQNGLKLWAWAWKTANQTTEDTP